MLIVVWCGAVRLAPLMTTSRERCFEGALSEKHTLQEFATP